MISFNSKNYIVKYKKATSAQWYGTEPRSNEYHQVFGIYREPDEINAIGSAMDMLCNLYASSCEPDLNKRQIIFYNEYDELDGVFYDFRATVEGEEDNFTDTSTDTSSFSGSVSAPENNLSYAGGNSMKFGDKLHLPIPDGYHACSNGSGENAGWAYIVPENFSLNSNHIDASPYSFGMQILAASEISFKSANIESFKKILVNQGVLRYDIPVDSLVISEECAFLYQNWIHWEDSSAATYNKLRGLVFDGEKSYQFHIFANYASPIASQQRVIRSFLNVCKDWMQHVRFGIAVNTKPTPKKRATPNSLHDFEIEDGCISGYHGDRVDVVVPEGIKKINYKAFANNAMLRSIALPSSLRTIGWSAFEGCSALSKVVLQKGLEEIQVAAFKGCKNLKDISIPASVKQLDGSLFSDCEKLEQVTIAANLTELSGGIFARCKNLKDVQLPETIETVGSFAFWLCEKLKQITLPTGLKTIGEGAFSNCKNLQELVIPAGVETIGPKAFSYCEKLERITFPTGVKTIEDSAFFNCPKLQELIIPEGLETIGESAFASCDAMASVSLPMGLKTISEHAFAYDAKLQTAIIPASVEALKDYAFFGCSKLKHIHMSAFVTHIGESAFGCIAGSATFHVVKDSYAAQYCENNQLKHNFKLDPALVAQIEEYEKKRVEEAERMRKAEREEAERKRKEAEEASRRALQLAREAEERRRKAEEERKRREAEEAERRRKAEEERRRKEAEEAERRRKAAEEAERKRQEELAAKRARYDEITAQIEEQNQIISQNRGWFGPQAKARKAAQQQLAELQTQLSGAFPKGRP